MGPDHTSAAVTSYERAYELFLRRGATHGDDWRDWLTAERELAIGGLSAREPMADAADYAG